MWRDAFARSGRRWSWLAAAALLLLVFVVANHRLVTGRAVPRWDADEFYAPYYTLVADFARAGRVLLWNPWTNAGSPDFAEPQVGAFSPVVVVFGALTGGSSAGFRAYWLFVWVMGALGMLLLGRRLQAPAWGAAVVSIGFVFSGFFVGHAEHTSFVYVLACFPFIVWRLDVALATRRSRPACEAGAFWGLSGVAGYPGLMVLNGLFALLWAVGRLLWHGPPYEKRPSIGAVGRSMVMLVAVGLVVMSPTYAGFMIEGKGFSDRVDPLPREVAIGSNALHPWALSTLFTPYLGSKTTASTLWPYTDMSSVSLYMGAVALWLAIFALLARPREAWRWWLCGVAILAIAFALGRTLPVRGWLYDLVPPTRYFRHAAMVRGYAIFYLAILALIGTRDLVCGEGTLSKRQRWQGILAAGALGLAAVVSSHSVLSVAIDDSAPRRLAAGAHVWMIWLGILGAAVAGSLLRERWRATVWPAMLVLLAAMDGVAAQRLSITIEDRDPELIETWRNLDARHDDRLDLKTKSLSRVSAFEDVEGEWVSNKNLLLKLPVLRGYAPFANRFHREWVRHPILRDAATGDERWWFAADVAEVTASDAAFEAFVRRSASLGAPPLVLHPRAGLVRERGLASRVAADSLDVTAIGVLPAATRLPIVLKVYQPNELSFEVSPPTDGWLLVTDRWAPGWRATVNGHPVKIAPADFIFRALPVRVGSNEIHLTYQPFGFPWLLVVSWGTLAAVTGWASVAGWRTLRGRGRQSAVSSVADDTLAEK